MGGRIFRRITGSTAIHYITLLLKHKLKRSGQFLEVSDDLPALDLFDVFKGQCQDNVFDLLEEKHIFYMLISANRTD